MNAGLNAADGNYGEAAFSLGGALIPGGADKGVRAGVKIGGKVADGFSDGVKAVGKRVDCHDANPLFRAAGKAMRKCFAGDTLADGKRGTGNGDGSSKRETGTGPVWEETSGRKRGGNGDGSSY